MFDKNKNKKEFVYINIFSKEDKIYLFFVNIERNIFIKHIISSDSLKDHKMHDTVKKVCFENGFKYVFIKMSVYGKNIQFTIDLSKEIF